MVCSRGARKGCRGGGVGLYLEGGALGKQDAVASRTDLVCLRKESKETSIRQGGGGIVEVHEYSPAATHVKVAIEECDVGGGEDLRVTTQESRHLPGGEAQV